MRPHSGEEFRDSKMRVVDCFFFLSMFQCSPLQKESPGRAWRKLCWKEQSCPAVRSVKGELQLKMQGQDLTRTIGAGRGKRKQNPEVVLKQVDGLLTSVFKKQL